MVLNDSERIVAILNGPILRKFSAFEKNFDAFWMIVFMDNKRSFDSDLFSSFAEKMRKISNF